MKNLIYLVPFLFNLVILLLTIMFYSGKMTGLDMLISQLYVIPVTLLCLALSYIVVKDYDNLKKYVK